MECWNLLATTPDSCLTLDARKKREIDKMPGTKAMTIVARHFLRKFYGWYKSGAAFNEKRFFASEAEFLKAA